MEQAANGFLLAKCIEAFDGSLGLQDFKVNPVLSEQIARFRADVQPVPDAAGQNDGRRAAVDQFLYVSRLSR